MQEYVFVLSGGGSDGSEVSYGMCLHAKRIYAYSPSQLATGGWVGAMDGRPGQAPANSTTHPCTPQQAGRQAATNACVVADGATVSATP